MLSGMIGQPSAFSLPLADTQSTM